MSSLRIPKYYKTGKRNIYHIVVDYARIDYNRYKIYTMCSFFDNGSMKELINKDKLPIGSTMCKKCKKEIKSQIKYYEKFLFDEKEIKSRMKERLEIEFVEF